MPAVELDLPAHAGWRRAVDLLALLALAAIVAWWLSPAADVAPAVRLACLLAALLATGAAWSARDGGASRLRWDGGHWWLATPRPRPAEWTPGRLDVMIDLQFAMLLRFAAAPGPIAGRRRWLAVDCRTQRSCWHALRCAAFAGGRAAAAAPAPRGAAPE